MSKSLIFFLFCFSLFANEESHLNKKQLLPKGKYFHHSIPKEECQKDKACMEEAKLKCISQKAKVQDCNEQYKGTWITTCECL